MALHRKKNVEKTPARTYNGKPWGKLTAAEKATEFDSSMGNPGRYAKDNFTPLPRKTKNKHGKK
jgi:hypothetical protein